MTPFAEALTQPLVQRLGWALLHFVWQGAVIAVVLAFAWWLLRRRTANARYVAGCVAMVLMAAAPVVTMRFVTVSTSSLPTIPPIAPSVAPEADMPIVHAPLDVVSTSELPAGELPPAAEMAVVEMPPAVPVVPVAEAWGKRVAGALEPLLPWTVSVWLLGVVALSVRLLGGWMYVQRVKRHLVQPVAERWQQVLTRLSRQLGVRRRVRLLESALAKVPTAIGWLRPVILLPTSALAGLTPEQLEAILAHELAHIRRYDYLVNLCQTVIETLLFYHPAVWWVSHRIRQERENCCDDLAVAACGNRIVYARALTELEGLRGVPARAAVAASGGSLLQRIRRVLSVPTPRSPAYGAWLVGAVVIGVTLVLSVTMVIRAADSPNETKPTPESFPLRAESPDGTKVELAGVSSSRAWHVMRQWSAGPLLLGLTQQLGEVIGPSRRSGPMWTGVQDGGRITLDVRVEDDAPGEIFVGFFRDAKWSSEPVQVRCFPGPGQYTIESLPAGEYVIGAMIGTLPVAEALGVHRTWPEPIAIEPGAETKVQVLVSPAFQKHASGWYNKVVAAGFAGQWGDMNPGNLLHGQVTGPDGQPIRYAQIQIREHNPGASGIAAPDTGTDAEGYFYYDGMEWPYRVGALWRQTLPHLLGWRTQYMGRNEVFNGRQTVNFQFDRLPTGTATVRGRVTDQHGNPVREFHLDVRTQVDWNDRSGEYIRSTTYRAPFTSANGGFEMSGLPEGTLVVGAIPFDIRAYERDRGTDVELKAGEATEIDLLLTARNVLYGRVLFEDGTPGVLKPPPWPEATTHVSVFSHEYGTTSQVGTVASDGLVEVHLESTDLTAIKDGAKELRIYCPLPSEEHTNRFAGEFPLDLLSSDRRKAGIVKIPGPLDLGAGSRTTSRPSAPTTGKSVPALELGELLDRMERAGRSIDTYQATITNTLQYRFRSEWTEEGMPRAVFLDESDWPEPSVTVSEVICDGDRVRETMVERRPGKPDRVSEVAYDGHTGTAFRAGSKRAVVRTKPPWTPGKRREPRLLAYRTTGSKWRIDSLREAAEREALSVERAVFDGREVILIDAGIDEKTAWKLWIDPQHHLPVRIDVYVRGLLFNRYVDIVYRQVEQAVWFPVSGTLQHIESRDENHLGRIRSSIRLVVDLASLSPHPDVSPETFKLELPDGTSVYDRTKGTRHVEVTGVSDLSKEDIEKALREFEKIYTLPDGGVLKRIGPPFPRSRAVYVSRNRFGISGLQYFRWRDGQLHKHGATSSTRAPLTSVLRMLTKIDRPDIDGDAELLKTPVTGDFIVRDGASQEQIINGLQEILTDACDLPVRMRLMDAPRPVLVARGAYQFKPATGGSPDQIEVYARTPRTTRSRGDESRRGDLDAFLEWMGRFLNRRMASGVENPPTEVLRWHTNRLRPPWDPVAEWEQVLEHVTEQTGLTFHEETRRVRVLLVERATKAVREKAASPAMAKDAGSSDTEKIPGYEGEVKQVLERVFAAYAQLRTYQDTFIDDHDLDADEQVRQQPRYQRARKCALAFKAPNRFALKSDTQEVYCDGNKLWVYRPERKQYVEYDDVEAMDLTPQRLSPRRDLTGPAWIVRLSHPGLCMILQSLEGEGTLPGRAHEWVGVTREDSPEGPVTCVSGTMRIGARRMAPERQWPYHVFVDERTHLIRELRHDRTSVARDSLAAEGAPPPRIGHVHERTRFEGIRINEDISDDRFVFKPGPDDEKVSRFQSSEEWQRELIGKPAPAINARDTEGRTVRLGVYRDYVVLLCFWGTDYEICMPPMRVLQEIADRYADKGVLVMGVNRNRPELIGRFTERLKEHEISFRQILDPQHEVLRDYRVSGRMTVVVVDQQGVIREMHRWSREGREREITADIDRLLEGKPLPQPAEREAAARGRRRPPRTSPEKRAELLAALAKVYALKPEEVVKCVRPPYPEERTAFRSATLPPMPEKRWAQIYHWDGAELKPERASSAGTLGYVAQQLTGLGKAAFEGDRDLPRTPMAGDFILRKGAPIEQVVKQFEAIVRRQFDVQITLRVQDVEREVWVVRGTYKLTPPEGSEREQVEIYDRELGDPRRGGGGSGTFDGLLHAVGDKIGRHLVSEVTDPPERVRWHLNHPRVVYRKLDPDKVLQRLTEQTGLTFERQTRRVRVLFVERPGGADASPDAAARDGQAARDQPDNGKRAGLTERFSLADALFARETAGEIFAVHRLERIDDRWGYLVTSIRLTDDSRRKLAGVDPSRTWYGEAHVEALWGRVNHEPISIPKPAAELRAGDLRVNWHLLGVHYSDRLETCAFEVHVSAANELEAMLKREGRETREKFEVSLPMPQESPFTSMLDALAGLYDLGRALRSAGHSFSLFESAPNLPETNDRLEPCDPLEVSNEQYVRRVIQSVRKWEKRFAPVAGRLGQLRQEKLLELRRHGVEVIPIPPPAAADATVPPDMLTGVVVDSQGRPVEGARVTVFPRYPHDEWPVVSTDAEGVFRIPGFGDAHYTYVQIEAPGRGLHWVTDIVVGRRFTVHLDTTTRLSGAFTHSEGAPAGRTTIILACRKETVRRRVGYTTRIRYEAQTDNRGRFDLPIERGFYDVRIASESGLFARYPEMQIERGKTNSLPATLRPGVRFEAKIVDHLSGEPVAGQDVWIWERLASYTRPKEGSQCTSNDQGVVVWESLMPGETRFGFADGQYMRRWAAAGTPGVRQRRWASSRPTLDEGIASLLFNLQHDMPPVVIEAEKGVTVTGHVRDPEGKPVPGARVNVGWTDHGNTFTGDSRYERRSEEDGSYTLHLPAGNGVTYHVIAHDREGRWANAVSESFESDPGDVCEFDLRFTTGGWVSGRVVDAAGAPLADTVVMGFAQDGLANPYFNPRTVTGADGRFELGPMRPGEYLIQPDDRQGIGIGPRRREEQTAVSVVEGQTAPVGDLRFVRNAPGKPSHGVPHGGGSQRATGAGPATEGAVRADELSLHIVDADGRPVAGAKVATKVRWNENGVRLGLADGRTPYIASDDNGTAALGKQHLFRPVTPPVRKRASLFVFHETKNVGAVLVVSRDDFGRAMEVTLRPLCRVHGDLTSAGLRELGRPLEWSHGFLSQKGEESGLFSHHGRTFEYMVPPGKYELYAYGGGPDDAETEGVFVPVEVKIGDREHALEKIDLPLTPYTSLYGKPAPELREITEWRFGGPVKLADLRGKVVLLDFGLADYPFPRHRLIELYKTYRSHGLRVIAVDSVESEEAFDAFSSDVRKSQWGSGRLPFPVALDCAGPFDLNGRGLPIRGATTLTYGIRRYPATLLIDRKGTLVRKLDLQDRDVAAVLERVLGLRSASAPQTAR